MLDSNLQKLLSFLVIVLAFFLTIEAYNSFQEGKYIGKDIMPTNTISVSGTGEAFAKPDIARISVSVSKLAATALEAQKQHTEAINKVVEFIKNSGVEDKDIKTSNYSINQEYDYTETGRRFLGYRIAQTLEVKIRNLDNVGKILSGATAAGANEISGVQFVIDNEDAMKREAREQAIGKAKEKAREIEKDLGIKLGKLTSFYESGGDFPIYALKSEGMGGGIGGAAPEIPTGENKITIVVNLTYEVK